MPCTITKFPENLRPILFLIMIITATSAFSQTKADTSAKKLKVDASFSFNSNGIASIPAFSLGKPALVASVNLTKGRFSYDPTLAYSLELKPWYIDNWFHYRIVVRPKFELKTGLNISTFCEGSTISNETLLKAERYFALSLAGTWKLTPTSSLTLDYWNDNGQERGTLRGHFIDLVADKSEIALGNKGLLAANMMLFYINYDGNNDGLFVSPKISASLRNVPFTLYIQATQALQSNIVPWPGFRWNIGLAYTL